MGRWKFERDKERDKRKKAGLPPATPANRGDWGADGVLLELGTVPDRQLAAKVGVSHQAISRKRKRLGIICARDRRPALLARLPPELVARLGTAKDSELAKEFGVRREDIFKARTECEIPAFRVPHGNASLYARGCRCGLCTEANTQRMRERMAKLYAHRPPRLCACGCGGVIPNQQGSGHWKYLPEHVPHGTRGRYNTGCRCDLCRQFWKLRRQDTLAQPRSLGPDAVADAVQSGDLTGAQGHGVVVAPESCEDLAGAAVEDGGRAPAVAGDAQDGAAHTE